MTEVKVSKKKISVYEFFFETPLYTVINKNELEENLNNSEVDAYSVRNQIETTYSVKQKTLGGGSWPYLDGYVAYELTCKRRGEELVFFTIENTDLIVKVGQAPSLADMQYADLGKKYDKELSKDDLALFKKAIGLAANGVGAGSFVYLRRVFEKLIRETYDAHAGDLDIEKKDFETKRMVDKVGLLKDYLPSQLVEMKSAYSILSSGVHELTEDQCLTYFPALKLSIQLILEQRLEQASAQKRNAAAKAELNRIAEELARANSDKVPYSVDKA